MPPPRVLHRVSGLNNLIFVEINNKIVISFIREITAPNPRYHCLGCLDTWWRIEKRVSLLCLSQITSTHCTCYVYLSGCLPARLPGIAQSETRSNLARQFWAANLLPQLQSDHLNTFRSLRLVARGLLAGSDYRAPLKGFGQVW